MNRKCLKYCNTVYVGTHTGWDEMCRTVLCWAVLCWSMLYSTVSCCAVLRCAVPNCAEPCWAVVCWSMLCCALPCVHVPCCTVLCRAVLFCYVLCSTVQTVLWALLLRKKAHFNPGEKLKACRILPGKLVWNLILKKSWQNVLFYQLDDKPKYRKTRT